MPPQEIRALETRGNLVYPLLKSARILWVDDNPKNNNDIVDVLNILGMAVRYARTNSEALDKIKRHEFDVIISDLGRDSEDIIYLSGLNICPIAWFDPQDSGRNSRFAGFDLTELLYGGGNVPKKQQAPIIYYTALGQGKVASKCSSLITENSYELINGIFNLIERKHSLEAK